MIKGIFFDVGGTLIAPYPSVGAIYSSVAERHGVLVAPSALNLRFQDAWKREKARRALVDKTWWRSVVKAVFFDQRFAEEDRFFEDLYAAFEAKEAWQIYPDVIETLKGLRQRGIRLAVASNWDARLPALLKTLDLESYFDEKFISSDMGIAKPDPRFFREALATMGLEPLEALHVGDDPEEDANGAESVGMRAYLIDRRTKPKNSRALVTLDEILLRL